jgi:hypothetical protein
MRPTPHRVPTEAAFITVSVISVLLTPMIRPAATTQAASTAVCSVPTAMTASVAVIASRLTINTFTVPKGERDGPAGLGLPPHKVRLLHLSAI